MTTPRTPEEEPDSRPQGDPADDFTPPPPPQWLNESEDSGSTPLLPEAPPFLAASDPPSPEQGTSEDATEAPAPAPDMTIVDFSPAPFTEQFPYAQQIPGTPMAAPTPPAPPAPEPPAPTAPQHAPAVPPPAEPFPYAQQIPSSPPAPPWAPNPPTPAPSPEPFPYAQEIPDVRPAPPPSAEPFPYAQEIPAQGPPSAPPSEAGPAASPLPLAPPPVIEEPWRTSPPSPARRRGSSKIVKRLLLAGTAGLAAAALAAGGFVVVSSLGGGGDAEPTTDARLARSIFAVEAGARTDGHEQELSAVAAAGGTVVAVGGDLGPQSSHGVFLFSSDGGRTFRTAKVEGVEGGVQGQGEVPAAVGGSARGWVAIGSRPGGGAVWTSQDGQDWRTQPDAVGNVFGPNTRVKKIVAGDSGFLAVGETSRKGDFSDSVPAVWLSADGTRWEPRSGDQIGLQVRNRMTLVHAAVAGNVMLLEALINPDEKQPGGFRRVWRSEDGGRTWADSRVPVPKGARGLIIGGGPTGFVAVREMKDGATGYGQVFVSRDGRSWAQAGRLQSPGYQVTSHLLGDDKGFAAVVLRAGDVLMSRSADGVAWRDAGTLPTQPGREIKGAALAAGQTVVAGREPGGGDSDPLLGVWDAGGATVPVDLAKVPGAFGSDHSVVGIDATGDRAVSVGSAAGDAAVWTSQDGGTWRPAQGLGAAFTRPGAQQLADVTGGRAGWLAVGYDQTAPRRPLVVTSADGTTWQATDGAAAFRGSSNGEPATNATASGTPGYVIVGTDGASAAAWFSADLKGWERGRNAGRDGALESQNGETRWMLGVTGGSFGFTAVGGVRDPRTGNQPSVWSSADGKQWSLQRLPLPAGVTEGHLTHVASNGNTLVATGTAATSQGLGWLGYISSDAGKTWRRLAAPGGDTKASVTALLGHPKGFAATGTTGGEGTSDVVALASADGSSWTASTPGGRGLGGDGDQQITGLTSFKNQLIAIGRASGRDGEQPVLWSRPAP